MNDDATQPDAKTVEDEKPDAEAADPVSAIETEEGEARSSNAAETQEPVLSLEERFQMLASEKADLNDKLLRALAEVENVRRRADKQAADAKMYSIERFARDLLSVTDNLARALEALPDEARDGLSDAGKALLSGVELTHNELVAVLSRHGVSPIDASPGAPFDPNLHQAVSQIPSEHPSGAIAAPFQAGWRIGDRTLRAAMVAVSLGPAN